MKHTSVEMHGKNAYSENIFLQHLMELQRIEVEVRAFVTDEEYERLHKQLSEEGELLEDTTQETWYFDAKVDLRLQRHDLGGKIWMKQGAMHDDAREEIEIPLEIESIEGARALFHALGYKEKVSWLRHRRRFTWENLDVSLDDTKEYGKILELEMLVTPGQEEKAHGWLMQVMTELEIRVTPKEEFAQRYDTYVKNWQQHRAQGIS